MSNIDTEFANDSFPETRNSFGIYKKSGDTNYYRKFSRIPIIDPYTALTGAKEFLFFTKPDLNIFSNYNDDNYSFWYDMGFTQGKKDGLQNPNGKPGRTSYRTFTPNTSGTLNVQLKNYPFFIEMRDRYPEVAKQLQYSSTTPRQPFMCLLSNAVKDTLDLPSISTREVDTPSTVYGTSITYEADDYGTDENHSFSLEFEDSKYLEVYMLFKCWHEYMRLKSFGEINPVNINYTVNKILHDQISIFKFIVADDGETIIHYSKLYGCRPQGVPRDSFSDLTMSNGIRYSINWKASFVEDMNPLILYDFNKLTADMIKTSKNKYDIPIYDSVNQLTPMWADIPYIVKDQYDSGKRPNSFSYKLKWR